MCRIILDDNSIDILSLNETKLDESIKSCELHIPGYELIRRDRDRNGGGVCFYLKTSINFVVRSDLNVVNLENLCLEIRKPNSKPFFVITWYRPPCSSIELFSYYESLIGKLDALGFEYYLVGDIKTESTKTSSNIYLSWTKIEYQNNLNPIALFSTLNKR